LRSAIDSANASGAASDTISFGIAGPGPHVISPTAVLPAISKTNVFVDGYTQPGAIANTLASGNNATLKIQLSGALIAGGTGIHATGDSCRIQGLAISDWGVGIEIGTFSQGCVIEGNFIGTGTAGTSCAGNTEGIWISQSNGNTIGGTLPRAHNVISCNDRGIVLSGLPCQGNVIQGNYIGTDKDGTTDLGNIVSGVYASFADSNLIGGDIPGAGNVISGNDTMGVFIESNPSVGNTIAGNFIGTDRTGTADVGNGQYGILIQNGPSGTTIGGATAAAANVVSCNDFYGIMLVQETVRNTVVGNLIGTDVTGLIGLGNQDWGILVIDADSNSIGQSGAVPNVISGMDFTAIALAVGSDANTITNNLIGVGSDGTTALGNGFIGIDIASSTIGNIIGERGLLQAGNVIANSLGGAGNGIRIDATATNVTIFANSIRDNSDHGIDLGVDGVTPNDLGDGDTGANDLQNYPVITEAKNNGAGGFVLGSLNSAPSSSYFVQVYASSSCDPSGFGEGETVVDTFTVSTNPSGNANFTHQLIVPVPNNTVLTATATNPSGSTSEFSNCASVAPWSIGNTLQFFLFSPVNMVVTDPIGDSIGIDSASGMVFNTIQFGSSYDTTTDVNSSDLSGPDGSTDDVVIIANPVEGDYTVRVFREDGAADSLKFTLGIRIDGNQLIAPDGYFDTPLSALGNTIENTVVWTAAMTLPGDCNADGNTTSADIIYLVNYVFKSGPDTPVSGHGDVNCSGTVTSADVIYLVNYVFKSGLSPCSHTAG
jgi:hypothetical protein